MGTRSLLNLCRGPGPISKCRSKFTNRSTCGAATERHALRLNRVLTGISARVTSVLLSVRSGSCVHTNAGNLPDVEPIVGETVCGDTLRRGVGLDTVRHIGRLYHGPCRVDKPPREAPSGSRGAEAMASAIYIAIGAAIGWIARSHFINRAYKKARRIQGRR